MFKVFGNNKKETPQPGESEKIIREIWGAEVKKLKEEINK